MKQIRISQKAADLFNQMESNTWYNGTDLLVHGLVIQSLCNNGLLEYETIKDLSGKRIPWHYDKRFKKITNLLQ